MTGGTPRVTRRTLLSGAALAGAGALLDPVAGAAAGLEGGRVFSRWVGRLAGESAVIPSPRRFALAGVQWSAPAGARIELRTRLRGRGWGPWALASVTGHDPDGRPASSAPVFGEPLWCGAADMFQLRSSQPVTGVRAHLVVRPAIGVEPPAPAAAVPFAAAALPLATPVLDAGPGQPPIIARSAWAGRRARPAGPANYGSVQLAFVHHTDNPNGYSAADVAPMLLAMFDYHRFVRGFFDIAYNFIIDAYGRIWEARAGGIDEPVIGAHAGGYNAVSTGVAVLGTFMSSLPPPAATGALQRLLAWKLSLHGVPSLGKVRVEVNPADAFYTPFRPGARVLLPRVAGHRDGDLTDCPGNAFYARLPAIRPRVAQLAGVPAALTLTTARATVAPGTAVALEGRLALLAGAPLAGAPVDVQRLSADAATTIATATTAADGSWQATVTVARTAVLRALHAPAPASVSDVVQVAVQPVLTLGLISASPLRVSGTVQPAKPNVWLDVYELVAGHRRLLRRRRVRVSQGRFTARPSLGARRGRRYVLVARTTAGGGTLAGASPPLRLSAG